MCGASAERKAQSKARYEYLKARGRCVECAQPAFAGRTLCAECLYKLSLRNIRRKITDEQKVKVYQLTGNSEAWFTVQDTGYVGSVEIRQKDKKYVAYYKLIYSKGDAICKVEGSDILI